MINDKEFKKALGAAYTHQYLPRMKFLEKQIVDTPAFVKWKKSSLVKKISVIDNMQRKGMFWD